MSQPTRGSRKRKTALWFVYVILSLVAWWMISRAVEAAYSPNYYWITDTITAIGFLATWLPPVIWEARARRSVTRHPPDTTSGPSTGQ